MKHSKANYCFPLLLLPMIISFTVSGVAGTIVDSKHNLSVTGPGDVRALTEDKICIFCHTPHNATPFTPLWNKLIKPKVYTLYKSSTLSVIPGQPSGPTRLCLSCHDGTIALGKVVRVRHPDEIAMMPGQETIGSSMRSYIGVELSDDHPVSFTYSDALPSPELAEILPPHLHTYGNGNIHCTTCHDPHDDSFGKFLVMDNNYSALCVTCHDNKLGWSGSSHATSVAQWNPPANEEPLKSVAEYGCEGCHIPHGAGGARRILRILEEEENCYPCHDGTVATTDIAAQFTKISHHPVEDTTIGVTTGQHNPEENVLFLQNHVECVDCHNPHAVTDQSATAPLASGALTAVSGRTESGAVVNPLTEQYELCFKCHGDSGNTPSVVERWINQTDTTLEFNTLNPSYHPVIAMGQNGDVPSLPSTYEPALTTASMIYCVDCHDSDESSAIGNSGPAGPHGSIYSPILRQQYGTSYTASSQQESESIYALCYHCHDRSRLIDISGVDSTFVRQNPTVLNLHREHVLVENAPCFICHDPHGVQPGAGGSHTNLINFATLMVAPLPGNLTPVFNDNGSCTGSCALVCHNKSHDGVTTGVYP